MNNINVRMALYVLAPLLTMFAPLLAGYGVTVDVETGMLSVHLETLAKAAGGGFVGGMGVSKFILETWGVK